MIKKQKIPKMKDRFLHVLSGNKNTQLRKRKGFFNRNYEPDSE